MVPPPMDKSKNKVDLREAGRKRLEEFRQKRLQKGGPAKALGSTPKSWVEEDEDKTSTIPQAPCQPSDETAMASVHGFELIESDFNKETEHIGEDLQDTGYKFKEMDESSSSVSAVDSADPRSKTLGRSETIFRQPDAGERVYSEVMIGMCSTTVSTGTEHGEVLSKQMSEEESAECTSLQESSLFIERMDASGDHTEVKPFRDNMQALPKHEDIPFHSNEDVGNVEEGKNLSSQVNLCTTPRTLLQKDHYLAEDRNLSEMEDQTQVSESEAAGEVGDEIETFYCGERPKLSSQQFQESFVFEAVLANEVDEAKTIIPKKLVQGDLEQEELDQMLRSLKEERAKLVQELQQASKTMQISQSEKGQIIRELEEMRQNCLTLRFEKENLHLNLSRMDKKLEDLAYQKSELESNFQQVSNQLQESHNKESCLCSDLDLAKQQLQDAISDSKESLNRDNKCREELNKMMSEREDLTSALQHADANVLKVEREKAELLSILEEKEQLLKVSMSKQAESEGLARKEAEQASTLKESLRSLQNLEKENTSLILQLKEQLRTMGDEKMELHGDLKRTRTELENLQCDNKELRESLQNLNEAGARCEYRVSQLQGQLEKIENENRELVGDLTIAKVHLQNEIADKMELHRFVGDYKNTLKIMQVKKGKVLADLQSLKEAKSELVSELEESKLQIIKNKEEGDMFLLKFMETIEQLRIATDEKLSQACQFEELQRQMEIERSIHANEMETSYAHFQELERERDMHLLMIENFHVQEKTTAEETLLLKSKIQDLGHQVEEGFSVKETLSSALESSRQQTTELLRKLMELSSQINDNNEEKQVLKYQLEALQKQIEEERAKSSCEMNLLSVHLQDLETERQSLLDSSRESDLQLKDMTEEFVALQKQIMIFQQQKQEFINDNATLLSTFEASKQQLADAMIKVTETNEQLTVARHENESLVCQLEELKKRLEDEKECHVKEMEAISFQLQQLQSARDRPLGSSDISKLLNKDVGSDGTFANRPIQDVRGETTKTYLDSSSSFGALDTSEQESPDMSSKQIGIQSGLKKESEESKIVIAQTELLDSQLKGTTQELGDGEAKHICQQKLMASKECLTGSVEDSNLWRKDADEMCLLLNKEIESLRQKLKDTCDDRDNLFAALENSRIQLMNLEEEKSGILACLKETERVMHNSNEQSVHLQNELEATNNDKSSMILNLMRVTEELECCKQLAEERNLKKEQVEEECKSSEVALKELRRQKESMVVELNGLKEQVVSLQTEKEDAYNELESLKSRLLLEEDKDEPLQCESSQLQLQIQTLEEKLAKSKSELLIMEQELQALRQEKLHLAEQAESVSGALIQQSVETEMTKAQLTADLELSRESLRELTAKSAAETSELLSQIKELQREIRNQNIKDADQVLQLRAHLDAYAKASCDVPLRTTDGGYMAVADKPSHPNHLVSGVAKLVKVFEGRASSSGTDSLINSSELGSRASVVRTPASAMVAEKSVSGDLLLKSEPALQADLESALHRLHEVEKERAELEDALGRLEAFAASQLQLNKELTGKVVLLSKEHNACTQSSSHLNMQNSCEVLQVKVLDEAAKPESSNCEISIQEFSNDIRQSDAANEGFVEQTCHITDEKAEWIKMLHSSAANADVPQSLGKVQLQQILLTLNECINERIGTLDQVTRTLVKEIGHLSHATTEESSNSVSFVESVVKWRKVAELAQCANDVAKFLLEYFEYLQTFSSQYITEFQLAEGENVMIQVHSQQVNEETDVDKKEKLLLTRQFQGLTKKCSLFLQEVFQHCDFLDSMFDRSLSRKEQDLLSNSYSEVKDRCITINKASLTKEDDPALNFEISNLQGQTTELIFLMDAAVQQIEQLQMFIKGTQAKFTKLQDDGEEADEDIGEQRGCVDQHQGSSEGSSAPGAQNVSSVNKKPHSLSKPRQSIELEDMSRSYQTMGIEVVLELLDGIHEFIKGETTWAQTNELMNKYVEASTPAVCKKFNSIIVDLDELATRAALHAKDVDTSCMGTSGLTFPEQVTELEMTENKTSVEVEFNSPVEKLEEAPVMASDDFNVEELSKQLEKLKGDLDLVNMEKANLEVEHNQMEQKLSSARDKLSLAISKGKGLVQQRDALKHALTVKSEEFDSFKAIHEKESLAKDLLLQEMELRLRESEKAAEDSKALEAEVKLTTAVEETLERILSGITLPTELKNDELTSRIEWVVTSYSELQDSVASAEHRLHLSENAVMSLNAKLQESQNEMEILSEALAKQQQQNELLLHKLQHTSQELSRGVEESAHEKALLQSNVDALEKQIDEHTSALKTAKETYANLSFALDNLLKKLQMAHLEEFGEKIDCDHHTDSVSRLEACIYMILDKHKLTTEEFDELTQRTAEIIAETEQQKKEREANELKQQQLLEKLALKDLELCDFSRKMEEAAMTMAYQEDEIQGFQLKLQRVKEELQSVSNERDKIQLELSEAEQKLLSLKEKLSLAVKKGKGLALQRDSLRQSLLEKDKEIDLLVATHIKELQEKDALLDGCSNKIRNLAVYEGHSHELQKELDLLNVVLSSNEHLLDNGGTPADFQSRKLVEKVHWVVDKSSTLQYELLLAKEDISKYEEDMNSAKAQLQDLHKENKFWMDTANAKTEEVEVLQQSLSEAHRQRESLALQLSQMEKALSKFSEENKGLDIASSNALWKIEEGKKRIEALIQQLDASQKSKAEAEYNLSSLQQELLAVKKRLGTISEELECKILEVANMHTLVLYVEENFTNIFHLAEYALTSNLDSISSIPCPSFDDYTGYEGQDVDQSGLVCFDNTKAQFSPSDPSSAFHQEMTRPSSFDMTKISEYTEQKVQQIKDQILLWKKLIEGLNVSFQQQVSELQQNLNDFFQKVKMNMQSAKSNALNLDAAKLQEDILELQSQIATKETSLSSILVEKENLEHTVTSFQKALLEKEEQCTKLKDKLVKEENLRMDISSRASLSEAKILDLEEVATHWENECKLANEKLQLAEENESYLISARKDLASLQKVLSLKDQELDRQALAIQDAVKQAGALSVRVKDLEDSIEQKQVTVVNLEASRSKAAAKLTATLNKFSELWKQCEGLLAEVEKLQYNLELRDKDLSKMKEEKARSDKDMDRLRDMLERKNAEILQSKSRYDYELSEVRVQLAKADNEMHRLGEILERKNSEIIHLQSLLEMSDGDASQLRQEKAKAENEINTLRGLLETKDMELVQLNSHLNEVWVGLTAAQIFSKVSDVVHLPSSPLDVKEAIRCIDNLKEEIRSSRSHAEKKEALVQELKSQLEVIEGEKGVLLSTLNEKQIQIENFQQRYVAQLPTVPSTIEAAPSVEIEEMSQRGKVSLHPSSSHVRGIRKPLHVAVDVDTGSRWGTIDDKGHVFKPLVTSRFIPKATHMLAERVDSFCIEGGRLLMRQPIARLGLSVYWISIHLWILLIISTAKF